MTEPTKINFNHRRMRQLDDITDLTKMLFPGNRNQQHAAARILLAPAVGRYLAVLPSNLQHASESNSRKESPVRLALKRSTDIMSSLGELQQKHNISRRTLQRTRAKLVRLGLIEHVSWMNRHYGGRQGWKLSGKMSTALRHLAERIDQWRSDTRSKHLEKEEVLAEFLRPG